MHYARVERKERGFAAIIGRKDRHLPTRFRPRGGEIRSRSSSPTVGQMIQHQRDSLKQVRYPFRCDECALLR